VDDLLDKATDVLYELELEGNGIADCLSLEIESIDNVS
jgi:hypothetical protein